MEKKTATTDLTTGSPIRQIILFALPLVFGTLFQQLYSFVDTIIVGRCVGVDALAGVGATYSLHFLTLGFVQGACVGFGIPVSQCFGAKDKTNVHRYLWNGIWLCGALSLVLTVGMTAAALPLLQLIRTPGDIVGMAALYIRILFLGIPASVLYNYSASVLRALGDSRHPFYFLLFSCGLNVVLDCLLVMGFGMGVAGAAIATVISQLISGLLNAWWLFRRVAYVRVQKSEMPLSWPHIGKLCFIGLPMGLEYSLSAIGAVIMQDAINVLGSTVVAAQTAGEKIRQMFTLPMESVGMAMATYAGQNYGAGRLDRVRRGIRSGLLIEAVYSAAAWGILLVCKGGLVHLVLGDADPAVTAGAVEYLGRISTLFMLLGGLMIFRYVLQGLGYSVHAIVSGVAELLGRGFGSWLALGGGFGFTAICYANPLAWGMALCYCVVMVLMLLRRLERKRDAR